MYRNKQLFANNSFIISQLQIDSLLNMENQNLPVLSKEEKYWNRQLTDHLDKYSNLRDWSELAAWLVKLKAHLLEWKGVVCDKTMLLKRLATSLNGSLPVALHEATLQIYELLFANVITVQSLQLTCIGLFSFYSIANIKNKQRVLELFHKYLPNFAKDISILVTGLLITILPSLIEMHEPLVKDTAAFIQFLANVDLVGPSTLYQSIWIAILRSPSCRIPGLKYISSKIGKGSVEDQNDEEDNFWNETTTFKKSQSKFSSIQNLENIQNMEIEEPVAVKNQSQKEIEVKEKDLVNDYCPNIETLVINALLICIEDSNMLVVKSALDFLYKYLPLKNQLLSDSSKMLLTGSVIWLLGKRDMSVTRKINLWLFGKPDDQNRYAINEKNIKFLIEPLIKFLKMDNSIQPLKIIFNLYSEHEILPSLTLEHISKDLIQFCYRQESNAQILKLMHRIIDRNRNEVSIFTGSLGKQLMKSINSAEFREGERILHLIFYLLNKMLKPEDLKVVIFDVLQVIIKSYQATSWKDREYMKNCLHDTLEILDKHKEILREVKLTPNQKITLDRNNDLYEELIKRIEEKEKEDNFEDELSLINQMLVKAYQIFNVYNEKWVPTLIRNIALASPHHYLPPIEVIGEALEKEGKLKQELFKISDEPGKNNSLKVSLAKVWTILSLGHLQTKIIPLLIRLIKFFPHFLETLLEQQFDTNSEMTIIKFSLFWSSCLKYLHIISSDQLDEVSKPGLFRMLQFLDNGNPLVKYNTNIWINQCFPNFQRVLNPLLEIMLKPKDFWYRTMQGQYVYVISPENSKVMKAVNQLKSIIKHTGFKFNKFAVKPITEKILPYYAIFKGINTMEEGTIHEDVSYISVVLEIIIRFTQTKYINSPNPGIDLAACEVLEVLIKNINSPELSNYVMKQHFGNLLQSLHFASVNEEHLLQIQLLNLLKTIFESNIRKLAEDRTLKQAISHSCFVNTILEGLNSSFPYIKERFVQFINFIIPLLLEYHVQCSEVISTIFNTYATKISYINSKKNQIINLKDLQISKKNAEILILFNGIKILISHFLNLQIKPFEKEKNQNDTDSGLFSLYSWKSYVNLKIEKKTIDSGRARRFMDDISKQILNELQELLFTMTNCWSVSQLLPSYKLATEGLCLFDYQQFHGFNKQLYLAQAKFETEETVESFIINFIRVLINTYPAEVMNAMIQNWSAARNVEIRLKILEILNFTTIPIENFYLILSDSINSEKIGKKRKINHLQFQKTIEQDIIHFCQTFTHYNFQNFNLFQTNNLLSIWMAFCKFLKIFENTKSVLTLYSLVELIDLFMKKNNPKEIIRDEKLKKQLGVIVAFLTDLVLVCSGKIKIISHYKDRIIFRNFLPLPSSVFDQYVLEAANKQVAKTQHLSFHEVSIAKGIEYCRIHAFLITKRIIFGIMAVLQNDNEVILVKKIREIVVQFLPIVEDKSQDSVLVESASDVVLSLLEKKHIFLKEFKHDILQIFNKDDFFICSSKTLHSWAKIIDLIIDNNKDHDIFHEYLDKVSLVSSIFSSYSLETKKKIKSFERICFILYSGKKDKYNDKAHLLVDKIIEVIKNSEAPQPVLILIFFCIRILILRMSPEKLTKLLSNVWQIIIFLLLNIFNDSIQEKDRLNLLWAALKLIQMISITEICQFHCHQWMFFYDFVGIKFESQAIEGTELAVNELRPKIHKFLSPSIKIYKEEVIAHEEARHLIIKEDKIDDIQLLKTKALLLSSYMVSNNQTRMKFDMREVEELIDNDFLNLDEFIFKFK